MIIFKGVKEIERDISGKFRYYLLFGDDKDDDGINDWIEIRKSVDKELDNNQLQEIIDNILAEHNKTGEQKKEEKIRDIDNRINDLHNEIAKLINEKQLLSEVRK